MRDIGLELMAFGISLVASVYQMSTLPCTYTHLRNGLGRYYILRIGMADSGCSQGRSTNGGATVGNDRLGVLVGTLSGLFSHYSVGIPYTTVLSESRLVFHRKVHGVARGMFSYEVHRAMSH